VVVMTTAKTRGRICLLRCSLLGTEKCLHCSIPDARGAPKCPKCRGTLYFVTIAQGRATWACRKDHSVSIPVGDAAAEVAADRELSEYRRLRGLTRQRASRARQRVRRGRAVELAEVGG